MKDPRVTDALANERTFLAYARTALAFIGFGFVIARFALFTREVAIVAHLHETAPPFSAAFGTVMELAGIACAGYGAYRYIITARAIRGGSNAPISEMAAVTVAATIGAIGLIVTWTVIAVH
jgi:putative membrane protein